MKIEEFFASLSGGCQAPGCTHPHEALILNARCHPGHGTNVEVNSKKRTIKVSCVVCNAALAQIEFPFVN